MLKSYEIPFKKIIMFTAKFKAKNYEDAKDMVIKIIMNQETIPEKPIEGITIKGEISELCGFRITPLITKAFKKLLLQMGMFEKEYEDKLKAYPIN